MSNAYDVVAEFERRVADFAGAPIAIAVESCTAALFLSMAYLRWTTGIAGPVRVPAHTYCSVPMAAMHAGWPIALAQREWTGAYRLDPLNVWDGAKRFRYNMFSESACHAERGAHGTFLCLSFHAKKHLAIGRGGMILTENYEASRWLRRARYDGREGKPYGEERITQLGWNMYMTPEQAARGLVLLDLMPAGGWPDGPFELYPDLRNQPVFAAYR
jgi:dTDP-4-amino-4,6-dideoxygalactose transaminase